jgi:hypothetical protein
MCSAMYREDWPLITAAEQSYCMYVPCPACIQPPRPPDDLDFSPPSQPRPSCRRSRDKPLAGPFEFRFNISPSTYSIYTTSDRKLHETRTGRVYHIIFLHRLGQIAPSLAPPETRKDLDTARVLDSWRHKRAAGPLPPLLRPKPRPLVRAKVCTTAIPVQPPPAGRATRRRL